MNLKNSVMHRSRSKKLDHFYSLCDYNSSVLDVGIANNEHNDSVNLFLNTFRLDCNQYTGLAIEPMDKMREKHPHKSFIEYSGGIFPFADHQFDWVFSNAVIEHVGTTEDQLLFLNEMLRVSNNVFFTTPNKKFPIESHTNAFLIHWHDNIFYEWCKKRKPYWHIDNLLLLNINDLSRCLDSSKAQNYKIYKNRILGYTMTFTVVCSKAL